MKDNFEVLSLKEQFQIALDEARTVLPGIQTLFGFQLIAVFNQRFSSDLPRAEQIVHLCATLLSVVSIVLVMSPSALHRRLEPHEVSPGLVECASRFLTTSLIPLTFGLSLDIQVVGFLIFHNQLLAFLVAAANFLCLGWFWFGYPMTRHRKP